MDDPNENGKASSEFAKALAVISNVSRGLPASFAPAEDRYPNGYGPPNRVDEGVRLRDVWTAISNRRWMIVLIVVLFTATTAVNAAPQTSILRGRTDVTAHPQ